MGLYHLTSVFLHLVTTWHREMYFLSKKNSSSRIISSNWRVTSGSRGEQVVEGTGLTWRGQALRLPFSETYWQRECEFHEEDSIFSRKAANTDFMVNSPHFWKNSAFNFNAKVVIYGLCFTYTWSSIVSHLETRTMRLVKIAIASLEIKHYEKYHFSEVLRSWWR